MKHRVKVVMLPTEDISQIWKNVKHNSLWLADDYIIREAKRNNQTKDYQHLYSTVSQDVEPIKVNDWTYDHIDNVLFSIGNSHRLELAKRYEYRKIITTDDPKLTIWKQCKECKSIGDHMGCNLCKKSRIPQVQQSFLKEYVANPNGKWEVEYETVTHNRGLGSWVPTFTTNKLKLNQDNEVNITSVEECVHPFKRLHWVENTVFCNKCRTTLIKNK